jgi:predicted transcriptional regulator
MRRRCQLIAKVHQALAGLGEEREEEERPGSAVPFRSSVKKDHIVCLEDGRKMKTLILGNRLFAVA